MLPSAYVTGLPTKSAQSMTFHSAARTAQAHAPDMARSSGGESSAAHVNLETSEAVSAPDQAAIAPRLRNQETAERTARTPQAKDSPTGPPPSFEESPLERQARVAFDPPNHPRPPEPMQAPPAEASTVPILGPGFAVASSRQLEGSASAPTNAERAEASFAETRTLAHPKEPAKVDVSR